MTRHCLTFLAVATLVACGNAPNKGPKKASTNNSNANNVTPNNVTPNNVTPNNVTPNNVTPNNVTPNNITPNNIAPNVAQPCLSVSPSSLNFGSLAVGAVTEASVTVENCSPSVAFTFSDYVAPDGFEVFLPSDVVQPSTTVDVPILFAPEIAGDAAGQVMLTTTAGTAIIAVQGTATSVGECPVSVAQGRARPTDPLTANIVAVAGSTIELTAFGSTAPDPIVAWDWSIVTRPAGSSAALSTPTTETPTVFVDLPGVYEIDLNVFTNSSPTNCPAARLRIDAADENDPDEILVQLVWDTPADANQTDAFGTDVDLHYMHPLGDWNMSPYDCYWQNPAADWSADGNASVDIDDTDGTGPENITHRNAGSKTYAIGVYYYSDNGFGPSTATVGVHRGGVQLQSLSMQLNASSAFWYVGTFNAGNNAFTANGTVSNGFP